MKSFQKEFRAWLGDRSEEQAAALLGIGRSTVGAYRRGKRQPTSLTLQALRQRMAVVVCAETASPFCTSSPPVKRKQRASR